MNNLDISNSVENENHNIVTQVEELVKKECLKTDPVENWDWNYHIKIVYENAILLGEKLNADIEIVKLAALLHDITRIKYDDDETHNITGALEADKILAEFNYPVERIELVKKCILSHRNKHDMMPISLEEKILASADALAHFFNQKKLLEGKMASGKHTKEEAESWLKRKLERSWEKMMPEAREMVSKLRIENLDF